MISPTDPFRFDDRGGHYGSGQADLAPVSPLAAPPRDMDEVRPLDPMGAPPSKRPAADEDLDREGPADPATDRTDASPDTQTSTASQSGAASAQAGAGITATTAVSADTPEAPAREESVLSQMFLLQGQADTRIESDMSAGMADTLVRSSGTPVDLLPGPGPETGESAGDFADMATRMDQMMAEMTARMETLSPRPLPDEDDDATDQGALADAQDRLDDLFGSLGDRFGGGAATDDDDGSDPFGAARDRLDDLAGGLGTRDDDVADDTPHSLAGAVARLDGWKAGLDRADRDDPDTLPSDPGGTLLARLFDGDGAPGEDPAAERFDGMADLPLASPTAGFDPGRWDDLADFG